MRRGPYPCRQSLIAQGSHPIAPVKIRPAPATSEGKGDLANGLLHRQGWGWHTRQDLGILLRCG